MFPAVSFCMAIAVEAYCAIENEKHRCLRQLGVRLVQYIDDRASPYTSRGSALFFETHIVKLVSALGGYLSFGKMSTDSGGRASFSKMQLFPLQTGEFLGFQIDTAASRVSIPEKKLTYFERICDELLGKPSTSAREKAKFVGLVVSFMPAVIPAKLFVKRMFAALGNVLSWDDVFETPEEETAVIRRYREHLRTWNGQSWTRLPVKLTLCGDASVELGAAFEVESTLSDGGALTTTTTVRFPESIARASSTHREAYTCLQTVRVAIERHGESLRGAGVVYIGDNLGKCQAISNWYARDELLSEILAELYQLCICAGI